MTENKKPDYTGTLEVALWEKKDKNGNTYFTVKYGTITNVFKRKEK